MLSLEHKFLFVHIPKTGGNSIQQALIDYSEDRIVLANHFQDGVNRFGIYSPNIPSRKHSAINDYASMLDREIFNDIFKFSCVRNPWDRLISFYFSPHNGVKTWDRDMFISLVKRVSPMIDYLRVHNTGINRAKSSIDIDYIIRYESLQDDFDAVCDKLELPRRSLPHRNKSDHNYYSEYYDDALLKMVSNLFAKDIELFRYDFAHRHT